MKYGGESGIRTHVRVSPKHAFQACAFSHSAISPASTVGEELLLRLGRRRTIRSIRSDCVFSILWVNSRNPQLERIESEERKLTRVFREDFRRKRKSRRPRSPIPTP